MKKRFVCVLMGIVLVLTNVMAVNALDVIGEDAIIGEQNIGNYNIVRKNMQTGLITYETYEEFTNYGMPVPINVINIEDTNIATPNDIIGTDDREVSDTSNIPYSAIAYMLVTMPDGVDYIGTAWLMSNNTAVTNAHNLYNPELGGWATRVRIYPAKNGSYEPYYATAIDMVISQEYLNGAPAGTDWGMFALDRNIGLQFGVLNFAHVSSATLSGMAIYTAGYPGMVDGIPVGGIQFECFGSVSTYSNTTFDHTADTSTGQSGSPIFMYGTNTVIGIHYGGGQPNGAVRLNTSLCNLLNSYIAEFST